MRKRAAGIALSALAVCVLMGSCGKQQSAKQLLRTAKDDHGKCKLVSKQERADSTVVLLRDELQGFEYEVSSSMYEFGIDGSSFGKVPHFHDGFEEGLKDYVISETEDELEDICEKYDAVYEPYSGDGEALISITVAASVTDRNARKACEECADVLQKYNLKGRMDGFIINVSHDTEWFTDKYGTYDADGNNAYSDYTYSSAGMSQACHIGSVKLPDCSFRDTEEEADDDFLECARMIDRKAVFVRKETGTFADTGLPLNRVSDSLAFPGPKSKDDPVIFRYYEADGKEFYLCDFLDSHTGTYYTDGR